MEARHFAPVLSLVRHALYAAAALPEDHPQRTIIRHQVSRIAKRFEEDNDADRVHKLNRLMIWYDDGAHISGDLAILSEAGDSTPD